MKPTAAATVKLPEQRPDGVATLLDFFIQRFPQIDRETWERRFGQGKVFTDDEPVRAHDPYQPLLEVHYLREVEREGPIRTDYAVLHDDDLLVIDKPPFLPVTPGGRYLENCLLNLLIRETGNAELTPLHRLDKDTAGVTIFSKRAETRSRLSLQFHHQPGAIAKEYHAVCDLTRPAPESRVRLEDHIARSQTEYHMQVVYPDREPNSRCEVETIRLDGDRALMRLLPRTGRKHQLRVQLAHAGWPIVNDRLYGVRPRFAPDDISNPLQLCCQKIVWRGLSTPDEATPRDVEWISQRTLILP